MAQQHLNRPRRKASRPTLRVLRIAGWRYSNSREAWVHRTFSGRVGPVFVDDGYQPHPELTDLTLFEAPPVRMPILLDGEGDRQPLPRRTTEPAAPVSRVFTRLSEGEEPRVVVVDGRPPQRGAPVPAPAPTPEGVVVPLKSARATG